MDEDADFEALLEFLKESRGFDFTGYKRPSLLRRIRNRMQTVGIEEFDRYADHLQADPEEFVELFNTILINVTSFFRDSPVWSYLAEEVVPKIVEEAGDGPIRVWCAACASGEETYSIAMLLAEATGKEAFLQRVKIYGTDVDEEALKQARQGVYSEKAVDAVPLEMRKKYFKRQNDRFMFDNELRRALIFGRHDLVKDVPISRIDLLLCRNVLMYFNSDSQTRVMSRLNFALKEGGFIVLGKAEMLSTQFTSLAPVDLKRRLFSKTTKGTPRENLLLLTQAGDQGAAGQLREHVAGREAAFESGALAQLVVDRRGILALANAHARSQFGITSDDLGKPLSELEVSYRPAELLDPVEEVKRTRRPIVLSQIRAFTATGEIHVDVDLVPLDDAQGALFGVSVTFRDVSQYVNLRDELEQSNQELETAMEELQSTNEELETTNEELQSTNEELETTNEELQSTNEELETMNEELQSTNEELATVNDEVRERSRALNDANSSMESILGSIHSGIVVLDGSLMVTAWNSYSEELWGLRADEARKQPFMNLDIGLPVDKLKPMIRACLDGGAADGVSVSAVNRRGKAIECRVTCSPLRGSKGDANGVILFMDSSDGA